MLVLLSNGNGSSPCIYHNEDNFYQQYPYIWGINQSSWFNINQGKGQKGGWERSPRAIRNVGGLMESISMVAHRASGNDNIIFWTIKNHSDSPNTTGNLIW